MLEKIDKHFGPDITPATRKNSMELSFVFSDATVTSIAIDKKINNSEKENNYLSYINWHKHIQFEFYHNRSVSC